MANAEIACATCGAQFVPTRPDRKYCGTSCRNRRQRGRQRQPDKGHACECWWCSRVFYPKRRDNNKACSRKCGLQLKGFILSARRNGRRVSHKIERIPCGMCGKIFGVGLRYKYCSDQCLDKADLERKLALHDGTERPCQECGQMFSPVYGDKRRCFCSDECCRRKARRAARRKYDARLRGATVETVDHIKVFERDNWRCGICGRKTLRTRRGTVHPRAPELDHIMPLSKGGEHSYRNTQCACRACNAQKSDTPYGQLVLL